MSAKQMAGRIKAAIGPRSEGNPVIDASAMFHCVLHIVGYVGQMRTSAKMAASELLWEYATTEPHEEEVKDFLKAASTLLWKF